MRDYRVACATYNGKLVSGQVQNILGDSSEHLSAWLAPSLSAHQQQSDDDSHDEGPHAAPDLVAVGFQEMIPLHLALAGLTRKALDLHDDKLRSAIESLYSSSDAQGDSGKTRYSLVARRAIGGIALLLYARDETIAARIKDVQVNTVGCGVFGLLGNKGAVGIRITLQEEESASSWTFVSAHLAAHQDQNDARSQDWQKIVRRLVFEPRGDSANAAQIYDSGHLFFFGDLNYRISLTSPQRLDRTNLLHDLSELASATDDTPIPPKLLAQDQLRQEQARNKTLHHLREGEITFPPTYKYQPGSRDEFSKKRVPGWCDRVLYASGAEGGVKVLSYRSVMDFTRSDHKPVAAQFLVPGSSISKRVTDPSPYAIDPQWRLKQLAGLVLDRLVGSIWCLVMFAGFNRDLRLGFFNIAILIATILYGRNRFL
ncbi:hypothetical protein JCM10908_001178 [Rhodotorula pacifica]|uniref:uncharacterized protein n=1 Tax=Rhodotorula pacifica TaxID=1495444 RepID=UPI00317016BD